MTPKEARKLVADALRSGEYKQGKCSLRRKTSVGDRFCCLGVACDIFIKNGGTLAVREFETFYDYNGSAGGLPTVVQDWLGMGPGGLIYNNVIDSLIEANDVKGLSFDMIADLFEIAEFAPPRGTTLGEFTSAQCAQQGIQ